MGEIETDGGTMGCAVEVRTSALATFLRKLTALSAGRIPALSAGRIPVLNGPIDWVDRA